VIDISHKRGIFIDDHESDLPQKLHTQPTPRIGGLGLFVGLICLIGDVEFGRFILISTIPAFLAGFLEDLYATISPTKRLLIMSFSTFLVLYLLEAFVTDFGFFTAPKFIGIGITIVAILGLINGTNLIDGFNGLSSGISLIILATFTATAYKVGDTHLTAVCAISFAALLGFYLFNFPSGKIFLGDGGAYTIGFLLASLAILLVKNNPNTINPFFALLALAYPVWEVIFSFSRRILAGKSPMQPDSLHLHQLIFKAFCQGKNYCTSLFIYPLVALFCGLAFWQCNAPIYLTLLVLTFVLVYCIWYAILLRKAN
jgi:UDP-GlcNAc:undecaprenyl-phosphate/decaprenyl-phosphate GlcNAc-1-phosphate transferase